MLYLMEDENINNLYSKFEKGNIIYTEGICTLLKTETIEHFTLVKCLKRHFSCDWGDIDIDDKKYIDEMFKIGGRLFSRYILLENLSIYIITEIDRTATTILLPDEY